MGCEIDPSVSLLSLFKRLRDVHVSDAHVGGILADIGLSGWCRRQLHWKACLYQECKPDKPSGIKMDDNSSQDECRGVSGGEIRRLRASTDTKNWIRQGSCISKVKAHGQPIAEESVDI